MKVNTSCWKTGTYVSLIFLLFCSFASAQDAQSEVKEKFKVYGNCNMCKKLIDQAAEGVDGVHSAKWNIDTKKITVKYDAGKTDLDAIKKAIAAVGYDTEEFRASDETYNALHHCCKYERPPAKDN